jgi:hypothetical protein
MVAVSTAQNDNMNIAERYFFLLSHQFRLKILTRRWHNFIFYTVNFNCSFIFDSVIAMVDNGTKQDFAGIEFVSPCK